MSDNINFDYKNLSPFKWFVLENFPFIEADFDALTEWQLFCKIGKEINKIIDSQNIVGEQAENLTNSFNTLYNYVHNYFDNLDVQEEINNKLNEMVEDGTLQEIISSYLNSKAIFGYDNVNDMKQATNLIAGSYAKTYGFYNYNDGGGSFYKITNENLNNNNRDIIKLNSGLFAVLVPNGEVNIKQFGAYGDGIREDTENIQACINYAHSNNLKCIFSAGTFNVMQIVLKDNYYFAEYGCKIKQMANVSAIVNEKIDLFGSGAKYSSFDSINEADLNDDTNKIIIDGKLEIILSDDEIILPYYQQQNYHGFRWLSNPETIDYFPLNLVGLSDSKISGVTITFASSNANINFGFCLRSSVEDCILFNGIDNCLQFFASNQCVARNNSIRDGGGGLLVMQNCQKCIFDNNKCTFTKRVQSVNDYIISIKNSKSCVITNNTIDGYGNTNSIGISISSQNGGCFNTEISSNSISNCHLGIFLEDSNFTNISNNIVYNSSKQGSRGAINVNRCNNVNINNNIINTTTYHGICLLSGNFINIINNIISNIPNSMAGVLFQDNNTETTNYRIENNTFSNDERIGAKVVWFPSTAKALFKHYYINNNMVNNFTGGYIRETTNVELLIGLPQIINDTIQIRSLAVSPRIILNRRFNLTKNDTGNFTIKFFETIENLNIIIKSLQGQYHAGYSPSNIKDNIIKTSYDDTHNTQHSTKQLNALLFDVSANALSDNPTTNTNAGNLANFGLDLDIQYEIDYTNWN